MCLWKCAWVAVQQKYGENVPHNLTEKEFWTRFFQSHYFHRDRISTGALDIFSECAKQDEKGNVTHLELYRYIRSGVLNVLTAEGQFKNPEFD